MKLNLFWFTLWPYAWKEVPMRLQSAFSSSPWFAMSRKTCYLRLILRTHTTARTLLAAPQGWEMPDVTWSLCQSFFCVRDGEGWTRTLSVQLSSEPLPFLHPGPLKAKYIITGNLEKMSNHLQFSSTSIIQWIKNQVKDLQVEFVTVSLIWDVCITNKIEDYKKKCPETCQPPNPRAKMQVRDVLQWWSSLGAQFHKTLLKL